MEEKSSLYRFLREYGFMAVFLLHFVVYGACLYIMVNEIVVDGLWLAQAVHGSSAFLVISIILIFSRCMDDVNVKYLDLCIAMVVTRCAIYNLKYFGLDKPYHILIFALCSFGGIALGMFLWKKFKKLKGNVGDRIAKALLP